MQGDGKCYFSLNLKRDYAERSPEKEVLLLELFCFELVIL